MSTLRRFYAAAIAFPFAFALLVHGRGNATPPLTQAPAAANSGSAVAAEPLPCLHPIASTPPTPGQIDPVRNPSGSAARSTLPLTAVGKRWTLYSLGVNAINAWTRADDGRIWLATGSGVKCVDEKSGTVRHDTLQGGSGLPTENIVAITATRSGDVWCFASKSLDSSRRSYFLCRLESGQAQWQTIRTFDLPIVSDDDESLNRPGLLASGRYLAVALPGEEHTPLLLWDGTVWKDLPIPAEMQPFDNQFYNRLLFRVSLVSLDDTHLSFITATGFHLLRLPSAQATAAVGTRRNETMFDTPVRTHTILAATPTSLPVRVESGYWTAVYSRPFRDGFARGDEDAPRPAAGRWDLVRVLPGGGATTMAPAPQPDGNAPGASDSPPQSFALHATDDGTAVWVAVTYEDNARVEAQIIRFDVVRGTWKVMLTIAPASSPVRTLEPSEGTPGRTPEDWSGIPMEMAAHLAGYGKNFPAAPYHAAFTALPTWFCSPQPLPEWPQYKGESIAKVRTDDGDTWSIETRQDGRVLSRRNSAAVPGSAPEWFNAPPAPLNPRPPIRGLATTPDGKLLVATDLSVQRFTPGRKRWEHVSGAATDITGPGTHLLTTAEGVVWVAGLQEAARLDAPDRRQVTRWQMKVIGTHPDNGLWLADSTPTESGPPRLFQIKSGADAPAAVPVAPYPAPKTIDPGTIFFAATGDVAWCSDLLRSDNERYDNCLLGYDTRAGKWLPPLKVISAGQFPVWRTEDGYYHAVISTPDGDAIFRIAGSAGRWERVTLLPDDPDAVSATPVPTTVWGRQARDLRFVSADRRRFWFHHGLGVVWEFDRKQRTWKRHVAPPAFFPLRFPLSGVTLLAAPRDSYQRGVILATAVLGDTLFAASESGLAAFDRRTHVWRWERLPLGVGGDPRMDPSSLTLAPDSLVVQFSPYVIGRYNGPSVVARFDRKALRWREMWYPGGPLGPGPDGRIYRLEHDSRSFWATTDQGLYRLDPKTRRWRNVSVELGAAATASAATAASSRTYRVGLGKNAVEPGKSVWVVRTYRDEQQKPAPLPFLWHYDVPGDRWEHFPLATAAGQDEHLYVYESGTYAQEQDAVWLLTNSGPFRFDRKTHGFTRGGPAFDAPTDLRYMFVLPDEQGVPIRWFVGSGTVLRIAP